MLNQKMPTTKNPFWRNSAIVKYTGIATQMLVIIGVFAYLGNYLDGYYQTSIPWLTALFSLLGVGIAMYQIIKQVIN